MRPGWTLAVPLAALALAACDRSPAPAPTANISAPVAAAPSPVPKAEPSPETGPLSRYVGRYPSDKVDGGSFLADPLVRAAVEAATGDPTVREFVLAGQGPQSPIIVDGAMIRAWGCETNNCGPHQWSLRIAPDGTGAEVCYLDSDAPNATPRWFAGGSAFPKTDRCQPG